jgi:predicted phosphodiesterase
MTSLVEFLDKHKVSKEELLQIIKGVKAPKPSLNCFDLGGTTASFILMGDTHCGHVCYNPTIMDAAAKVARKENVDFVLHGGDVIEGHYEGHRPGHVLELTHIGADKQVEYAAEELKKLGKPLFFIEGNHAGNTIFKQVGYDVGQRLEELIPQSKYLGRQHGTLKLAFGKKIQLIHPDGGTAYAISYKPQKIVESLEGGTKPDLLTIHHFHKSEYLFYRNVHAIQAGTLERQTPFMRNNGIPAHCGFWHVVLQVNKKGISRISPTYYPFY